MIFIALNFALAALGILLVLGNSPDFNIPAVSEKIGFASVVKRHLLTYG